MYQDRIQKNGNVCRCGLGFPEPPSEDDFDGEAETQCGSANERLLFRLGQVHWNEFGKDGAELSGLLEAVRAEASRAVPPSPPPTITERLAVSKKALAERHAIVVQQTAKVANIQKAEASLRSLKDELAALDVKLIGAELAVDLAEAALRGRDPLEGDGDDDGDDVEDLGGHRRGDARPPRRASQDREPRRSVQAAIGGQGRPGSRARQAAEGQATS